MGKKIQYIGRYLMDGKTLGKGNFARVELATHGITKCKVAVKIIDTRKIRESYVRKNLHREARILSQLRHPNVIRLYETLKASSFYCLVLESANGGELLSFIRSQRDSRLTEEQAWPFVRQMVSALCYMHERGVVHRDLKMENILLDEKKRTIKIVDFGLSNIYKSDEPLRTHCGSPEYAAPELFINNKTYGPEVDLWSLGINMYALVVGKLPFTAAYSDEYRRQKLLKQIQKGLVSQHYKEMAQLTLDCQNLLLALIEPEPDDRITSRDLQAHTWITRNGHWPFHHYVAPPPNQALRAQVVEELSSAMDLDVTSVDKVVNEFRSDELSAMFNMLLDHHKVQESDEQDVGLRRDSALSSIDGSLPSTSAQCTPEVFRMRHSWTPSPEFTGSSRSSSGHGSLRSSKHSRDYSHLAQTRSPTYRQSRSRHNSDRRCMSCDLPDNQRKASCSVSSAQVLSTSVKRESVPSSNECLSSGKAKDIRLSRLEQMRHKLFSSLSRNEESRHQPHLERLMLPAACSSLDSTPETTPRSVDSNATTSCAEENQEFELSTVDSDPVLVVPPCNEVDEQYTGNLVLEDLCEPDTQCSLSLAPHASPEDTHIGSDSSITSPTAWTSKIPVRCFSNSVPPRSWKVSGLEDKFVTDDNPRLSRMSFAYRESLDSPNLSDEDKLTNATLRCSLLRSYSHEAGDSSGGGHLPVSRATSSGKNIDEHNRVMVKQRHLLCSKRANGAAGNPVSRDNVTGNVARLRSLVSDCTLDDAACPSSVLLPSPESTLHTSPSTSRPSIPVYSENIRKLPVDGAKGKTGVEPVGSPEGGSESNISSQTKSKLLHGRRTDSQQAQWKSKIARLLKRRLESRSGSGSKAPPGDHHGMWRGYSKVVPSGNNTVVMATHYGGTCSKTSFALKKADVSGRMSVSDQRQQTKDTKSAIPSCLNGVIGTCGNRKIVLSPPDSRGDYSGFQQSAGQHATQLETFMSAGLHIRSPKRTAKPEYCVRLNEEQYCRLLPLLKGDNTSSQYIVS